MAKGVVYLVGAGPGDPSLLTLAGKEVLARADCVVYDRLIDPRVLDWAPASAERIYVGKTGGKAAHCPAQSSINDRLIELAKSGKRVVRLKGGDSLLFARGGEEAMALAQAGVSFEIIPGVTAGLAAAATAAIPLTFRGVSSAVAFVTGHEEIGNEGALDWDALARFPGTLVVYMGLKRFRAWGSELISRGKAGGTPVAFVEWGGSNRQRVVETTLAQAIASPPMVASPSVIIVGDVTHLRKELRWFESRPLFGQRVLLTRPRNQADRVIGRLESLGAQTMCQPVFSIEPPDDWTPVDRLIERLGADQAETDRIHWLVFTSRNGVSFFFDRLFSKGHDLRLVAGVKIAAIGPGTAESLSELRLRADLVPDVFLSEALAEALKDRVENQNVVLVRANRGRRVLEQELGRAAGSVETVTAYRQVDLSHPSPEVMEALNAGEFDWVFLSSSNMARGFFQWLDKDAAMLFRKKTRIVSISPVTSQAIRAEGFDVAVEATTHTLDGMIEALLASLNS